jgi:hypothetical protein
MSGISTHSRSTFKRPEGIPRRSLGCAFFIVLVVFSGAAAPVHRTLMELYRLRGQIGAALRQYET